MTCPRFPANQRQTWDPNPALNCSFFPPLWLRSPLRVQQLKFSRVGTPWGPAPVPGISDSAGYQGWGPASGSGASPSPPPPDTPLFSLHLRGCGAVKSGGRNWGTQTPFLWCSVLLLLDLDTSRWRSTGWQTWVEAPAHAGNPQSSCCWSPTLVRSGCPGAVTLHLGSGSRDRERGSEVPAPPSWSPGVQQGPQSCPGRGQGFWERHMGLCSAIFPSSQRLEDSLQIPHGAGVGQRLFLPVCGKEQAEGCSGSFESQTVNYFKKTFFFWPHPQHAEVPGPGIDQTLPTATIPAAPFTRPDP